MNIALNKYRSSV